MDAKSQHLTLFVSGFNLPLHTDLLTCTGASFVKRKVVGKMIPIYGWADLIGDVYNVSATMVNQKYFIEDLKENLISESCQEEDGYNFNYTISLTDDVDYWGEIDDRFIYATGNAERAYASGDNSIRTAMTKDGFKKRKEDGLYAADDFERKIRSGTIKLLPGAVIDVVSHSMGFAFSLGLIEGLQQKGYTIGWVYAIAPENPGEGYVPSQIDGIWQYGSQETDPFAKQDGIAPQKAIPGITDAQRVPIDPSAPQNFLESHLIANYKWIFTKKAGQLGYVKTH